MTRPASYPLSIYRGDSYRWRFAFWVDNAKTIPMDLSGVVAAAQIRDKPDGQVMDLDCSVTQPNFVDVAIGVDQWDDSGYTAFGGGWDLQLTYPSGDIVTVVAGAVKIQQDVTA